MIARWLDKAAWGVAALVVIFLAAFVATAVVGAFVLDALIMAELRERLYGGEM